MLLAGHWKARGGALAGPPSARPGCGGAGGGHATAQTSALPKHAATGIKSSGTLPDAGPIPLLPTHHSRRPTVMTGHFILLALALLLLLAAPVSTAACHAAAALQRWPVSVPMPGSQLPVLRPPHV